MTLVLLKRVPTTRPPSCDDRLVVGALFNKGTALTRKTRLVHRSGGRAHDPPGCQGLYSRQCVRTPVHVILTAVRNLCGIRTGDTLV